ncbi:MAG TPA: hypothetical protein VF624_14350 [Tepidisphaeraceae bacterium]|jgi:hypothetical protein
MLQIDDAIVRDHKLVLSNLPFADGQRVRVVIDAEPPEPSEAVKRLPITEVRRLLKGCTGEIDDPSEPMIPIEDWEMLK